MSNDCPIILPVVNKRSTSLQKSQYIHVYSADMLQYMSICQYMAVKSFTYEAAFRFALIMTLKSDLT